MRSKEVLLFTLEGHLIKIFDTTLECANYFGYTTDYINHNLKYCKRIKKEGKYYVITRLNDSKMKDLLKEKKIWKKT